MSELIKSEYQALQIIIHDMNCMSLFVSLLNLFGLNLNLLIFCRIKGKYIPQYVKNGFLSQSD